MDMRKKIDISEKSEKWDEFDLSVWSHKRVMNQQKLKSMSSLLGLFHLDDS